MRNWTSPFNKSWKIYTLLNINHANHLYNLSKLLQHLRACQSSLLEKMAHNTLDIVAANFLQILFQGGLPLAGWQCPKLFVSLSCILRPVFSWDRALQIPGTRRAGWRGATPTRRCQGTFRDPSTTAGSRPPSNPSHRTTRFLIRTPPLWSPRVPGGTYLNGAPGLEHPLPVYHQPLPPVPIPFQAAGSYLRRRQA